MTQSPIRSLALVMIAVGGLLLVGSGSYFVYRWLNPPTHVSPTVTTAELVERVAIPVPAVTFTNVTAKAGIHFHHVNGAFGKKLLPETMGSGVAVLDYDGDGKPDLLFINSCPWPGEKANGPLPTMKLYRNKGDGTFEDVTEAAGLAVTLYGMGVAVGDYDNDGWPDIYVTTIGKHRLFHNESDGKGGRRFVDVTDKAGVGGPGPDLPKNISREAFLKYGSRPGETIAFGSSATFLDYDGDGKLDLFVCHYVTWSPDKDLNIDAKLVGIGRAYVPPTQFDGAQCVLYRNKGDGTFEDVSEQAGIRVLDEKTVGPGGQRRNAGKSLGVVVCDPDGDGYPDLIVANDTVRNFFFHNEAGPDGKRHFRERGQFAGIAYAEGQARGGMGIDWAEYRPGRWACVIANFANEPSTFLCLDRPERLLFSDEALAVGLAGPSRLPLKFGAFFFDFDLDGRPDLITADGHLEPEISQVQASQTFQQPAQLFWNTGRPERRFEPMTAKDAGPDLFKPIVGRGGAYLDFDGDGDLDIVLTNNNGVPMLLRNDQKLGHHWLRLRLEGDGKRSNRSAIGALVTVEVGGERHAQQVTGTHGYLSQSELTLTFGLGQATKVDKVTIRWPGKNAGPPQVLTGLAIDKEHHIKQGP